MCTAKILPPPPLPTDFNLTLTQAALQKGCFAIAFHVHPHLHRVIIVIISSSSPTFFRNPEFQHQLPHLLLHRTQLQERVLGAAATQKKDGNVLSPNFLTTRGTNY